MNKNNSQEAKPPAVPRRTQSAKVLSSYQAPSRSLRVTDERDEQAGQRQPTRRCSQKNKTRRSLDAMEQQANELFGFLTDLETKKASGSETDLMTFLSKPGDGQSNSKSGRDSSERGNTHMSSRAKRVSVRDRAKLFLKPDIKEEANEDAKVQKETSRHPIRRELNEIKTFNCNSNNNKNIDSFSRLTNGQCPDESKQIPLRAVVQKDEALSLSAYSTNFSVVVESATATQCIISEDNNGVKSTANFQQRSYSRTARRRKADSDTNDVTLRSDIVCDLGGDTAGHVAELRSEGSNSSFEAELSLESSSRSHSTFSLTNSIERPISVLSKSSERLTELKCNTHAAIPDHASLNGDLEIEYNSSSENAFSTLNNISGSRIDAFDDVTDDEWVRFFAEAVCVSI